MRRFFLTLLVVVLVMGIVYLSAPFFAFRALKAAARVEDVAAITEVVDFPAVRASLTEPVQHAPVRAEAPSIWQDPLGAMKHVFQPLAPPEPRVDRYLTPAGLYDLTRGYDPGEGPPAAPPAEHWWDRVVENAKEPWPSLFYWDPNRVRFDIHHRRATGEDRTTVFTFARRGWFAWKLVHIGLPKDVAPVPQGATR